MQNENKIALYAGQRYRIEKYGMAPQQAEFAKTYQEAESKRLKLRDQGVKARIFEITAHGTLKAA